MHCCGNKSFHHWHQESLPLDPVLSQMDTTHSFKTYSLTLIFNIFSHPKFSISLSFPAKCSIYSLLYFTIPLCVTFEISEEHNKAIATMWLVCVTFSCKEGLCFCCSVLFLQHRIKHEIGLVQPRFLIAYTVGATGTQINPLPPHS